MEWFIFKRRLVWKANMMLCRVIAICNGKWFLFLFFLKYHKISYERQGKILERYIRMEKYKLSKRESFDRCLARMIAEASDRLGMKQYEIREVIERIVER